MCRMKERCADTMMLDDAAFEICDYSGLQGLPEGIMIVRTICA